MRPPSLPIAYLCLALSMVLVGSYVALSKPLVAVFPVLLLAWLRFAIGAVAMLHWLPAPAHEAPLSRRTHGVLWQNITLALGIKAVFLVLAVFGSATMWMAVFADMGASLLVVANGLRLLRQ